MHQNKNKIRKILRLGATFVFSILIGLILFNSGADAATYDFNPSSGNLIQGCNYYLVIEIDATGENSNAADLEVHYNPAEITIKDSLPGITGTQVQPGNAYEAYFYNKVDATLGKIQLAAGSFVGTLTTKKVYGIVQFATKPGITATTFTIDFSGPGATLDSNIADTLTSLDLLTNVTNGSYTFSPGSCIADITPPPIQFLDPKNGDTNVPLNTNVDIQITDDLSGVDLDSIIFDINGVQYKVTDPQVAYSGDPLNYRFIINPTDDFPADQPLTIRVIASDLAGNSNNRAIIFNIPAAPAPPVEECDDCPVVEPPPPPVPPQDCPRTGCPTVDTECPPGGDCYDDFLDFLEDPDLFDDTFLENTWLARLLKYLGLAGSLAALSGLPLLLSLLWTLFPYLSLLYAPGFIQDIWALIVGKKKKPWGIVTNAEDDKPIPFAIVTASYVESNALVKRVITDTEGRYNLDVNEGSYILEVRKTDFESANSTVTINEKSGKYAKDFELYPLGAQVPKENKKVDKKALWWQRTRARLKVWWKYIKVVLFIVGFVSSILAVIITPNIFNWIVFCFYIVAIIVLVMIKYRFKKPTSMVINFQDRLKMPFVKVKFHNLETQEIEDAQISDEKGAFDFWGEPGTYGVWVYKHGFYYPIEEQRGYEVIEINKQKMLKIKLTKGKNRLRLYLKRMQFQSRASTVPTEENRQV